MGGMKKMHARDLLTMVTHGLELLVLITYIAILGLGAVQVFLRYVVGASLFWAEEVVTYTFIFLVFIGASLATRSNQHPYVDSLMVAFGPKSAPYFGLLRDASMLLYAAVLVVEGLRLALATPALTPVLQFPYTWIYMSMPFGSLFIGLYSLVNLADGFRTILGRPRKGDA
jgi:TRAP-type C4-dicarboxylate transport system permease small subunit